MSGVDSTFSSKQLIEHMYLTALSACSGFNHVPDLISVMKTNNLSSEREGERGGRAKDCSSFPYAEHVITRGSEDRSSISGNGGNLNDYI